jgi:hypothetical protein
MMWRSLTPDAERSGLLKRKRGRRLDAETWKRWSRSFGPSGGARLHEPR